MAGPGSAFELVHFLMQMTAKKTRAQMTIIEDMMPAMAPVSPTALQVTVERMYPLPLLVTKSDDPVTVLSCRLWSELTFVSLPSPEVANAAMSP
jgi:hypothetical protein